MDKKNVYIEKLSKKDPMFMSFDELQDWLDHCIYDKMKYHTFDAIQKDTFEHLLIYRLLINFFDDYYINFLHNILHTNGGGFYTNQAKSI